MDYEYVFSKALHDKLKSRIWGHIHTKISNNILKIVIEVEDKHFEMELDDFSHRFLFGMTTEYVAYEVEKKYRKFIMKQAENKYFIKQESV